MTVGRRMYGPTDGAVSQRPKEHLPRRARTLIVAGHVTSPCAVQSCQLRLT